MQGPSQQREDEVAVKAEPVENADGSGPAASNSRRPARRNARGKNIRQHPLAPLVTHNPEKDKMPPNCTGPAIAYTWWQIWNKIGGDNNCTYRNFHLPGRKKGQTPFAMLVKQPWNPNLPCSSLLPTRSEEAMQESHAYWQR